MPATVHPGITYRARRAPAARRPAACARESSALAGWRSPARAAPLGRRPALPRWRSRPGCARRAGRRAARPALACPSMPGMTRSSTMTSGRSVARAAQAFLPLDASITSKPATGRHCRTRYRATSSSSITSTRTVVQARVQRRRGYRSAWRRSTGLTRNASAPSASAFLARRQRADDDDRHVARVDPRASERISRSHASSPRARDRG